VRRSGSLQAILVIAGAAAVSSAGLAAPAAAAPRAPQAVSGPALYGFGTNQLGELGNGTQSSGPSLSPVRASGPPGTIKQLTTGFHSAGALLTDGTVWTWGQNYYHQLGYNSANTVVTVPTQVPGLSGITQIDLSSEGNGYAV